MTQPTAKPYDDLAISRSIAGVSDPALQGFLEAVVDVVTGISFQQQNRNVEQRQALTAEVAAERQQIYDAMRDIRHQLAQQNEARQAESADRQQVTSFLERIVSQNQEALERLGKVETKTDALNERIGALSGVLSDFQEATNEKIGELDNRVGSVEQEVAALRQEMTQLTVRVGAVEDTVREVMVKQDANRRLLEAIAPPPEVQARMDANRDV